MSGKRTLWMNRYVYAHIIMAAVTGFIVGILTLFG
jgi:hypothetical protein